VRRTIASGAVVLASIWTSAGIGSAVTNGELDGTRHPNVGMIVFYAPGGRYSCSATLASPTVLVTAAHCTSGLTGKAVVTFESTAPRPLPRAADDTGNGISVTGFTTAPAGWSAGTPYAHPGFDWTPQLNDLHDVGVVVLDAPYTLAAPAQLPPRHYLDGLAGRSQLQSTLFTMVGYGISFAKPDAGPQRPEPVSDRTRRFTEAPGSNVTSQVLLLAENGNDSRGGGGTCYGDSGGAVFQGGYLVADTSYGWGEFCRSQGVYYRLDTDDARAFLGQFLVLP
jgi:hypothetical protein